MTKFYVCIDLFGWQFFVEGSRVQSKNITCMCCQTYSQQFEKQMEDSCRLNREGEGERESLN